MTNKEVTEGLKPCPFCGGGAGFGDRAYWTPRASGVQHAKTVNCMNAQCLANLSGIGGFDTVQEAAAAWNTRAPQPVERGVEARVITESEYQPVDTGVGCDLSDEQVKHMANRFLSWKLPEDFRPDGGIGFKQVFGQHWPIGTNVFTADQAEAMVRHMAEDLPVEDHNPDGFTHASPEVEQAIADAVRRRFTPPLDSEAVARIVAAIGALRDEEGDPLNQYFTKAELNEIATAALTAMKGNGDA